jgi:hypothetical protein
MSALSEVSILFGQNAADIEKARQIFTAEIRGFVAGALGVIKRARSEPWIAARVRLDIPRDIENEAKTGYVSSQFALARSTLRFKKGTNFAAIGDVTFGIEYIESADGFVWRVALVPAARYQRVDDVLWREWRRLPEVPPGAAHHERANTVTFVERPLVHDLTLDRACEDVKQVFDLVVGADGPLAEAVGMEATAEDEANAVPQ